MQKDKVVFILGATAVGKSEVAVSLAQKFSGEIISADSVQIFKGLDIGSAKITKNEMKDIPHYGIDIVEPTERFSVFDFVNFTKEKIKEISSRKKLPIVVGGTGLYVKALTLGYNFGGAEYDEGQKVRLENLADEKGLEYLFEMLQKTDPVLAEKTDRFNRVRVVRALQIALAGGEKQTSEVDICPLVIALDLPREEIYKKINKRVDVMLQNGLVEEVKSLLASGVSEKDQSMHAIGYKEVISHLKGEISYDKMVELIKQHSRNYAKRQLTFLRGMDCEFVDMSSPTSLEKVFQKVQIFLDG